MNKKQKSLTNKGFSHDSQSPALSTRVGGTAPTFAAMNGGIFGLRFATNNEAHGSFQLPHSAIPGGELRLHVHFRFANGSAPVAAATIIWSVEYEVAAVNASFGAVDTRSATYIIGAADSNKHLVQALYTATLPSPAQSAIVNFRIYRSGGTSAVDPFLLSIDGHYQQGSYWTTDEYPA